MINFFELFGIPQKFALDMGALEQRYFELQREYHPDRVAKKSAAERSQAMMQSMGVNEAYQTLKSPLKRAEHLLALHNISIGDNKGAAKPSQELLADILERREQLQGAADEQVLAVMDTSAKKDIEETLLELAQAFDANDLQVATEAALKLSYLTKLLEDIRLRSGNPAAKAS